MHLVVIVFAKLCHRLLNVIVIRILEVVVYLFLLIRIKHFFDEVVDVDLRAAEDDCLQLVQHLLHTHAATLRQVIQIHTTVDRLNDLFLSRRTFGYRADAHVFRTDDLVLFHVFFNNAQELIAVTFCLRYTYTRNRQ